VVSPFNSEDLDVPLTLSSLVHLALQAVTKGIYDPDEHSQKAEDNHDIYRNSLQTGGSLQGHQVGPNARQRESQSR